MSRSTCPECGAVVIVYARLEKFKDGPHGNTGNGAKFDHAKAVQMFKAGRSVAAIAQTFNVHYSSVLDVLKRKGVYVTKTRKRASTSKGKGE